MKVLLTTTHPRDPLHPVTAPLALTPQRKAMKSATTALPDTTATNWTLLFSSPLATTAPLALPILQLASAAPGVQHFSSGLFCSPGSIQALRAMRWLN